MATAKQIAANRRNAQKSTGPKTPRGKAAIRFNNLRHGTRSKSSVLPGESLAELDIIQHKLYRTCRPATPEHRYWIDRLAIATWKLGFWKRAEAAAFHEFAETGDFSKLNPVDGILRRLDAYQRACYAAQDALASFEK